MKEVEVVLTEEEIKALDDFARFYYAVKIYLIALNFMRKCITQGDKIENKRD